MKKEAKFWKPLENNIVECNLCNHNCMIKPDQYGSCGVRKNQNGKLYTMIYGSSSSIAVDPIEKKPFYHFHPGSNALSLGTVGCNFKCLHCQNYSISRAQYDSHFMQEIKPKEIVNIAKKRDCQGIAWTYNEPTIWHEFSFNSSKLAKKAGLYTAYVSNGYIQKKPLEELAQYLDAINIDIKAFTDDFYKKICKTHLEPVLKTCILTKKLDIHLEVTYLIIPKYNDSDNEIKQFCNWIVDNLGKDTPVHFSCFHPDYKMNNVPRTPIKTMKKAYNIALTSGIKYTYLGNIPHGDYDNTICPKCGNVCISRYGFSIDKKNIKNGKCKKCGQNLSIKF